MAAKKSSTQKKSPEKAGGSLGGIKMKQLSLMSFFKPVSRDKAPCSPPRCKAVNHELHSEKEELNSMADSSQLHETPLTLESEDMKPNPLIEDRMELRKEVKSSPIHESTESQAKAEEKMEEVQNMASPSVHRRARKNIQTYYESDSETEVLPRHSRKKQKVVDSDEEDDYIPAEEEEEVGEEEDDIDIGDFVVDDEDMEGGTETNVDEESDYKSGDQAIETKPKKRKAPSSTREKEKPNLGTSSGLGNKFGANASSSSEGPTRKKPFVISKVKPKSNFVKENEERYQWLVNIKDAEKRSIDDPSYDSRTLYIPQSAWSKFTAFEKQYWEIKSKMWDTVVFFKKGKFYELYENDAMIANNEFDLKIAGGGRANMKLAGIPEMSFEYWAKEFISHGYKVAKVDQKETLLAKEMRGGSTKEEKIIKRELTSVLTGGTLTDLNMINDDLSIYCLSIKEQELDGGRKIFGVAFVDTASSELNLLEIIDDNECTKLDTLVTQIRPKEIVCEKNNLCPIATKILKFSSHNSHQIWNNLTPLIEFWDYDTTIEELVKSRYYKATDLDDYTNFPKVLLDCKDKHQVAFNAFGGLLFYLKSLKLDKNIMTLGNIRQYEIHKSQTKHLVLDGTSLCNLEILNNSFDGGDKGTLFKLLNRAYTPFGKRKLKNWILNPLTNIEEINSRYDSIDFFINGGCEYRDKLESVLQKLPDLERLLARIHGKSLRFRDFLRTIEGFERIANLVKELDALSFEESGALLNYIKKIPSDLRDHISEWEEAFNREDAVLDIVSPSQGVDEEFDESSKKIKSLEESLHSFLRVYKRQLKSNEICFKDSGKEVFLIEVPNRIKNIPNDWQQMGSTSKVKRYWSPEVRKAVRELMEQRETHKSVCETLKGRMYEKFNHHYKTWMIAISCIASIDCLLALAKTSESIPSPSCKPQFIESDRGFLEFRDLRHPCFVGTKDFIPNDIVLGGKHPKFGLLTGANAAGKSTIMRTSSLAVILSQIGCYLPASLAKLSPVDKIMTRLGANDNIMQGKSTFFVELSETKKILSSATPKSLVILDELGRGGSSSDGYSIAESVLYHIGTHIQCLGFFATHYGTLSLSFKGHPQIRPLRMGILVEEGSRNITFLYKLEEGTASGSFGMHVASMCGIENGIVDNASKSAKTYEQTSQISQLDKLRDSERISLGIQSDFSSYYKNYDFAKDILNYDEPVRISALENIFNVIANL